MNKVNIVYYSFTGNTLRMVKAFEKGLQEANVPFKSYSVVELKDDNEAFDCEILALASPANQTEEIEKNYFQPFMKRNTEKFKDKKIYLFGTFGWGTGKFMGTWIKQVEEPYKNGKLYGTAKAYDENGKVIHQATFKNGEEVK